MDHPLPENLIIVPTHRAPLTLTPSPSTTASTSLNSSGLDASLFGGGLALSSRNAYLTPLERTYAPTLYAALRIAQDRWETGEVSASEAVEAATSYVSKQVMKAQSEQGEEKIEMRLDYISLTDPETFEPADWVQKDEPGRTSIISGALFVGRTRLIDNLLSGDTSSILGGPKAFVS